MWQPESPRAGTMLFSRVQVLWGGGGHHKWKKSSRRSCSKAVGRPCLSGLNSNALNTPGCLTFCAVCPCMWLGLQTNWNCWDDTDSVNNNGTLPATFQGSRRCLPATPALPNFVQKFCNGTWPGNGNGGQFNDYNFALIGTQGTPGDGGE